MLEKEIKLIEDKIDALLSSHQNLQRQNKHLADNEISLLGERADLMKKNDLARSKVEAIISRLKGLEQN
ncbi:MAG: TIGR02449 family protein [Pseudomonadales bacterium]|nr:TIGR02449 family protein [Pseudomonadales bacterium]